MRTMPILLVLFFQLIFHAAFAQVKYEKEFRLDKEEVPDSALLFLEGLNFEKRIKWYLEEGLQSVSIEAKTKSKVNGKKYSIEFSKSGSFEDVEIEIDWMLLPIPTQRGICNYLAGHFEKYKIQKIQVQFTGSIPKVQDKIRARSLQPDAQVMTHYELVAKVKKQDDVYRLELLFNQAGAFVRQARLVSKNTDNLEY